MTPAIDRLTHLIEPPRTELPPIDWTAIEAEIQTPLPQDYKQLTETYGSGQFGNFIHVFEPVTPLLTVQLAFQLRRKEEILQYLRDARREEIPYPPGQLQAIAGTDNGDTLYWVRTPRDEPDAWTIVGNPARDHVWPRFDGGLVEFLIAVLSREIRFPIFPKDFPCRRPAFKPAGPISERLIANLRAQGLYRDL